MTTTSTSGDKEMQQAKSSHAAVALVNKNTSIGKAVFIKGNVKAVEGDILINGRIDGAIELKRSRVEIGADGHIDANIHARAVVIHGEMKGDVYASEQVVITKTGRVFGNVYSSDVTIEDGALLKGRINNEAKDHAARAQHMADAQAYDDHEENLSLSSIFKKVQEMTHLHLHHAMDGYNAVAIIPRNDGVPQKRKEGVLYLQKTGDGIIKVYTAQDKEPKLLSQKECEALAKINLNLLCNKMHKLDDEELIASVISICGYVQAAPREDGELLLAKEHHAEAQAPLAETVMRAPENNANPLPVFLDKSVIGPSLRIEGELVAEEDVECRGQMTGMIYFKNNTLEVCAEAQIKANIFVKALISTGEIHGDVCASELVTIKTLGRLYGNVVSPRIKVESGAMVTGSVEMEQKSIEKLFSSIAQNTWTHAKVENNASAKGATGLPSHAADAKASTTKASDITA